MRNFNEVKEQVRQANDIVDRISEHTQLKPVGQLLNGLCIFHKDTKPSLFVYPHSQSWYCFGCCLGGDVFDFYKALRQTSFWEALKELAAIANIPLPNWSASEIKAYQEQRTVEDILTATALYYHSKLETHTTGYLLHARGYKMEFIKLRKIGYAAPKNSDLLYHLTQQGYTLQQAVQANVLYDDGREYYKGCITFPNWVNSKVAYIQGRPFPTDPKKKFLNPRGKINHLYNEMALRKDVVILTEAVIDCDSLLQWDFNSAAILGTSGFKKEWTSKFERVQTAYLSFDSDDAGREASLKIAELLGPKARIVSLPDGMDVNDYYLNHRKMDFEQLLKRAKTLTRFKLEQIPAMPVHLMDVNDAECAFKKVSADLMVASIGETFVVPKLVDFVCNRFDSTLWQCPVRSQCILGDHKPHPFEIPDNSREFIEFVRSNDSRLMSILTQMSPCQLPKRSRDISVNIKEYVSIQEFLGVPKAQKVLMREKAGQRILVDELGREYRDKLLYHTGVIPQSNRYFRAIGWAIPSPKGQEATMLTMELEPLVDDYERFVLTDEAKEQFKVFQPKEEQSLIEKHKEITRDITDNITNIYGGHRERALLGILLAYHSCIGFSFDGERLKRGWCEMVMVGDSGEGKTQLLDRIMQMTELGECVSGVTSSRTGISYSYQQYGKTWYLVWGKYPKNDGRLLFVDEAHALSFNDVDNMRKGRSEGVITADGIKPGEHNSRTRLIFACNPKFNAIVDSEMFGVEVLPRLFKNEDIRRFDFAILLSSSDQTKDEVNRLKSDRERVEQNITPEILHDSICWAWTRKPEQIVFTDDAVAVIIDSARKLSEQFQYARDVPLISTDIRHKLARLSVADACLLHSTDEPHEKVIVKPEHPLFILHYLRDIYSHSNMAYDIYAKLQKEQSILKQEEFESFMQDIRQASNQEFTTTDRMNEIFKIFIMHRDGISRTDMASILDVTPQYVSTLMRVLRKHKLIHVNRGRGGGYKPTPKFIKILKKMIKEDMLEL